MGQETYEKISADLICQSDVIGNRYEKTFKVYLTYENSGENFNGERYAENLTLNGTFI